MNEQPTLMHPELAAALHKAQSLVLPVGKNAEHKHHGYQYVSADVMIGEGRAALREAQLSLSTPGWRFEAVGVDDVVEGDGKPQARRVGRVVIQYMLVHTSGHGHAWEASSFVIVEKGRPADKAELGAITENLAYTIRGLLQIPRVDESIAMELRDDRGYEPAASRPPASSARPTAANDGPADVPPGTDPAHAALVAEFKRRLDDVGEFDQLAAIVAEIDAVKFPRELLADVRASVATVGLSFAVDQEDLDFWVDKLKAWNLPDPSAARDRVNAAFDVADARIERLTIQGAEGGQAA